jgi:hypothetical protein
MRVKTAFFLSLFVLAMSVAFLAAVSQAQAFVHPSGAWRGHEDVLSRVLVAEADRSVYDWAAILWTLQHRLDRYGDTPSRIMSYSATLKSDAARPRSIRVLTPGDASARGRQVAAARAYVEDWIRGRVMDPCPDSLHWHGIADSRPRWFQLVDCGTTKNSFGKVRSK